jgi:hypothetical protein
MCSVYKDFMIIDLNAGASLVLYFVVGDHHDEPLETMELLLWALNAQTSPQTGPTQHRN